MSFARLISPLMLQNSIETPSPFHTLLSKQSGAEINCHRKKKLFKLNQNCFVEKNDKKNIWLWILQIGGLIKYLFISFDDKIAFSTFFMYVSLFWTKHIFSNDWWFFCSSLVKMVLKYKKSQLFAHLVT